MVRRPEFIPIEKATLVDLYWDQRLTLEEIGEKLDVHFTTVQRRMVEYGIPRRNLGPRRGHRSAPVLATFMQNRGQITRS